MSIPPDGTHPLSHRPPRRSPPAELEQMLRSPESQTALTKEQRDHIVAELKAVRRTLEQRTCSAAWLANCWESGETFPPGERATAMVACECERCRRTGRLWPPHYAAPTERSGRAPGGVTGFLSYECYLEALPAERAAELPSSPSGLALRAIREGRIKLHRQRTHTASRRFVS